MEHPRHPVPQVPGISLVEIKEVGHLDREGIRGAIDQDALQQLTGLLIFPRSQLPGGGDVSPLPLIGRQLAGNIQPLGGPNGPPRDSMPLSTRYALSTWAMTKSGPLR